MAQAFWQNLVGFILAAAGLPNANRTLDEVWPVRIEPP